MLVNSTSTDVRKYSGTNRVSLSKYFPKGTVYFYGYPSGEESGFLNRVPPSVEELVAARALVCAGSDVDVITFASTIRSDITQLIHNNLGSTLHNKKMTHVLPEHISEKVMGKQRNNYIKRSLKQLVSPGSLVMAQPYMDQDLETLYQISPRLTNWLNDKQNMTGYIPKSYLPTRYRTYQNGRDFFNAQHRFPMPCVIKVSSSSAGDGVYICQSTTDVQPIKQELQNIIGTIIVEQYIDAITNYGIQFGIPEDPDLAIDIIGVNQQLTTPEGEFIGGIIDNHRSYPELNGVKQVLLSQILPEVRRLGWYGVGCFDVLISKDGGCYIIDCNFRMTGMTAYLMLSANKQIAKSLVSFSGAFKGNLQALEKAFSSLPQGKKATHVLALTEHEETCSFNAALLFDSYKDVPTMAQTLLAEGIISKALEQIAHLS